MSARSRRGDVVHASAVRQCGIFGALDAGSTPMGKQQPVNDKPDGLGRFEREARRERWVSRIFYGLTALAFAGYL